MHGVPLDHVCPGRLVNPDVFDGRLFNRGCRVERVMRVSAPSGEECCHKTSGRAALLGQVFLSQFALGRGIHFRGGHGLFGRSCPAGAANTDLAEAAGCTAPGVYDDLRNAEIGGNRQSS